MNSGKIVAGRVDGRKEGEIKGSTRGPRGPKKLRLTINRPAGQIGSAWRQKHQRLRMILAGVMFGMLQFFPAQRN